MKDKKSRIFISIIVIFWILFAAFILIIASMFGMPLLGGSQFRFSFIPLMIILPLLGIALIVLVTRIKIKKASKAFFILTGASAIGIAISGLLHNLLYALLIKLFGEAIWNNLGDEPVFFIFAVIICPIALLVGAIGTIVLLSRKRSLISHP